ncbi:hypothetical protein EST38_g5828 [Candolleomyces aberdarensis]|uniref:Fungal-type protein kinase domain-containing protein n=1 Tax=Candolleomyces aberdarensis TaxID=2316362 RepID=A0A4Q2DJH4_9AGAR|nr:hypothetical protein EST38_g5828 [Candolleomyces aberdarensis]
MGVLSCSIDFFMKACLSWRISRAEEDAALNLVKEEVRKNRPTQARKLGTSKLFMKAPSETRTGSAFKWTELKEVSDVVAKLRFDSMVQNGLAFRGIVNAGDDLDELEPSGALTRKPRGSLRATDIIVPFALSHTRDDQVREEIRTVAKLIMQKDFRRNFVYAIAIEDSLMTLWYFSRSHTVKSKPVNYIENPSNLIAFLTYLMFATDVELGLDPRISFIPEANAGFVYHLGKKPYLVVSILNQKEEATADAFLRRTRVFKAIEIAFPTSRPLRAAIPIILKDTWIGAGSPTESQIEQKVLADVEAYLKQDDWKSVQFVENLRVAPAEPEETSVKAGIAGPESLLGGDKWKGLFVHIDEESAGKPVALEKLKIAKPDSAPKFKQRTLTRYEKEGIRVDRLPNVGEAMNVLNHGAYVLYTLFCAGWVHGDISINNIMGIENEATGEWNLLLGTFRDAQKFQPAEDDESDENDEQIQQFLGDVEAIWWTAVFILSTRVETGTPKKKAGAPFKLNKDIKEALQVELDANFVECLHEDLQPLANKAEEFRIRLEELELSFPKKNEIYEAAYTFFSGITEDQKAWSKAAKLDLKPWEPTFIVDNPACERRCKVANKGQPSEGKRERFTKRERPADDDDGREDTKRKRPIGDDQTSPGPLGGSLPSRNTLENAISGFKLPVGVSEATHTWAIPTAVPSLAPTKAKAIGALTRALPTPTVPSASRDIPQDIAPTNQPVSQGENALECGEIPESDTPPAVNAQRKASNRSGPRGDRGRRGRPPPMPFYRQATSQASSASRTWRRPPPTATYRQRDGDRAEPRFQRDHRDRRH